MDDKLRQLLQDEMQKEADIIMDEVNKDPMVRDAEAPESVREKLFQQIREHEEKSVTESMSEENKELIRLGKVYKKKKKRRKYYVFAAVLVLALSGGVITSMGGPERVAEEFKRLLGGREQNYINTGGEQTREVSSVDEEEAYQQIEDEFGVYPVRSHGFPDGIEFSEIHLDKNLQTAYLIYEDKEKESKAITYCIYPNSRTSSIANDVEDELTREYTKEIEENTIQIKEYEVGGYGITRWGVTFEHKGIQYLLTISGLSDSEFEKVVENLYFY